MNLPTGPLRAPAALGAAAVALAGFAVLAHQKADALRGGAAVRNVALTDNARTSEVKGAVTQIVNGVFSYAYTDPARTAAAVKASLTGAATGQYAALFAKVGQQGPARKLVLTTTVTDSAVTSLRGDRAHLIVYADQRSTGAADGRTAYAAALLTVDAVRTGGHWKIASLRTF
ncbi:nuclear transport factor 2 family protein [Actinomadura parmotrematis]|uniref:Nuclear transport factor 2 family protein n=1 Tax=Actinomadura parmotrematis TaxID=2864039 RepID=A0ABS7FN59_9ACTN|nr:nuclear transport factor 2 family protein [Actinomadura parmotrematis]MBW8481660.1 nuclear transport factor 2 family protein [Actinomadura parmotrematis]